MTRARANLAERTYGLRRGAWERIDRFDAIVSSEDQDRFKAIQAEYVDAVRQDTAARAELTEAQLAYDE